MPGFHVNFPFISPPERGIVRGNCPKNTANTISKPWPKPKPFEPKWWGGGGGGLTQILSGRVGQI